MDDVTDVYDLHSWFTTGDSAPERRNDYTLTLTVPYDSAEEKILPACTEGALAFSGFVQIPANGRYEFSLHAINGARLYVDGRMAAEPPTR